jgi:hypothetical protein
MSNNKNKRTCKNCRDYVTLSCGEGKTFAPCVGVEYDFPDFSSLLDDDGDPIQCATLQDVVEDVYTILEDWKLDLTEYDKKCLDIDEVTEFNILQGLTDIVCEHEGRIDTLENVCNILNKNITLCGLDLTCLEGTDDCDNPVNLNTLKDVLQALINKTCPTT